MYLPTRAVRYPAACNQVATVDASWPRRKAPKPPSGPVLSSTRWLWGYWPVRMEARDGAARGRATSPVGGENYGEGPSTNGGTGLSKSGPRAAGLSSPGQAEG